MTRLVRGPPIHSPRADSEKPASQPFTYPLQRAFAEPDWNRIPAYRGVSVAEWESVLWQRRHTMKNVADLKKTLGAILPDALAVDIERDQRERATMSLLVTPHIVNTMTLEDLWNDPARRYFLPAFSDRQAVWPSHPKAQRDSLHEAEMWKAEGLTERYPTKVLAELVSTCPQYCGHCTRMDLVGNDVPQVMKVRFAQPQRERWQGMLDYLRRTPSVRDVLVSGGDVANVPIAHLEFFVSSLLDIPTVRDIRIASKSLMGLPQHWLQDSVCAALERLAKQANERDVSLALHTHINHANQVTPLMARAAKRMFEVGLRDVRNQGVLLNRINATTKDVLELCFTLLDRARVMPYYFYACDMIPNSEHWRVSIAQAQQLQHDIMGYLPGFATPRFVCDVPYVGKRWVHQPAEYDRVRGISLWTKNYRTGIEARDNDALTRKYPYYDPIHSLPEEGQAWWQSQQATK